MSQQDLRKAAAQASQAAAERGAEIVEDVISRVQPLVEAAVDTIVPLAQDTAAKVRPIIITAGERVAPLAHEAKVRSADFAARKLDELQPAIDDVLAKVTPTVDAARERIQHNVLPELSKALHAAAEHPVVAVVEAPVKKKSKFKKFVKFMVVAGAIAGALTLVKRFLSSQDDGWTAHEPSKAYVSPTDDFADADSSDETPETTEEQPVSGEDQPALGEGSFVGDNPPAEFFIKGNERSMKYHMPGTGGFERTIPDVWFSSEEAAAEAGFTRAQR